MSPTNLSKTAIYRVLLSKVICRNGHWINRPVWPRSPQQDGSFLSWSRGRGSSKGVLQVQRSKEETCRCASWSLKGKAPKAWPPPGKGVGWGMCCLRVGIWGSPPEGSKSQSKKKVQSELWAVKMAVMLEWLQHQLSRFLQLYLMFIKFLINFIQKIKKENCLVETQAVWA